MTSDFHMWHLFMSVYFESCERLFFLHIDVPHFFLSLSPIRVLECLPTGLPLSSSIWPHYGVLSPGNSRFFCGCHDEDSLMTSYLPPCASLHYGWKVLLKSLGTSPECPPQLPTQNTHTHSLLSLVTSSASKGWLELTIPQCRLKELVWIFIQALYCVVWERRVGGRSAVNKPINYRKSLRSRIVCPVTEKMHQFCSSNI